MVRLDTSVLQQKVVTMNLWGMLGAIVIVVVLTVPELARGEDARCSQVRAGVAKYGQAVAIRWARANGYSAAPDKTGAQMSDPSRKLVTGQAAGIALAIMKL